MEVLIKLSDAIKTLKSMAVPLVRKLPSAQPEWLTDYSFEESCTDCPAYDTENHRCPRFNQVIRRALKDANLEPCEDCISRQAAIDEIKEIYEWHDNVTKERIIEHFVRLPSAQPDTGKATWAIHTYMPHNYYCTNCKQDSPYNKIWDFCPHCGFKMEDYV